jgi:hypothetical protein
MGLPARRLGHHTAKQALKFAPMGFPPRLAMMEVTRERKHAGSRRGLAPTLGATPSPYLSGIDHTGSSVVAKAFPPLVKR